MSPYFESSPLPGEILNCAIALIQSKPPWVPALVYSYRTSDFGEQVDTSCRDAFVSGRETTGELYSVFEQYVYQYVLPSAISHWGLGPLHLQGTQLVRYRPGGKFAPHRDADAVFTNRCLTILSYLSEDFTGGETYFPAFNDRVQPKIGKTIVFLSEHLHAGLPVIAGEKYILATWALNPVVDWI